MGMNDLQHISDSRHGPVLVTLNPSFEPDLDKVNGRWKYDHPVSVTKVVISFLLKICRPVRNSSVKAVKAQNEAYKIQNTRSISYVGAYLKYGFHKDGFTVYWLHVLLMKSKNCLYPRPHLDFQE